MWLGFKYREQKRQVSNLPTCSHRLALNTQTTKVQINYTTNVCVENPLHCSVAEGLPLILILVIVIVLIPASVIVIVLLRLLRLLRLQRLRLQLRLLLLLLLLLVHLLSGGSIPGRVRLKHSLQSIQRKRTAHAVARRELSEAVGEEASGILVVRIRIQARRVSDSSEQLHSSEYTCTLGDYPPSR
jgi:hypothetical protein